MANIVHFLDCDIHWKYFCLCDFLAVLWIVILACNRFIVVFSDRTLDMSVILSGSPFVLTLPGSSTNPLKSFRLWYSLVVLLIRMLPCSRLYCNTP